MTAEPLVYVQTALHSSEGVWQLVTLARILPTSVTHFLCT